MGNGKNRKDWKALSGLIWNKHAYLCDKKGNSVTADTVAKPSYDPWVTIQARKPKEEPEDKSPYSYSKSGYDRYIFLHHPESGEVYYRKAMRDNKVFSKIKRNRKTYSKVIEKIEESEVTIYKGMLRGVQGKSKLDAGFIFVPINPLYYGTVTVEDL